MKILILLPAGFFAVPDALALAFDAQHVPLVTKLALADLNTAFVLIFECEFRTADFNNDYLVVEVVILHGQ